MKLIVGLGNPGKEYQNTRHNIGFYFIDSIADSLNLKFKEKFNGLYVKTILNQEEIMFLKPLSYMNLSGEVVKKYADYFKISSEDILVIQDDIDMELAKIKLKANGTGGGHHGIKNIVLNLKSEEFKRLKIGVGKDKQISIKDYVLSKFNDLEKEQLTKLKPIVLDIIYDYTKLPFNDLMSKYNNNNWRINEETRWIIPSKISN